MEPSQGRVLFHGEDIRRDLVSYRKRLGYVPEEPNLYPYLSGREYLEIVGILRGMPQPQLGKKIDGLLELFSLYPSRHSSMASYSKGMRQRILLIASLLDDPELLILDEPCAGLDPVAREQFLQFLERLSHDAGAPSLVLVTHHVEEIMPGFSHVLILKRGHVLASGAKDLVMSADKLSEAFGATLHLSQSNGRYSLAVTGNASKVV